ncbi:MAG: NADP-dependent malic enzyme [Rickettsiales bacterium]|nr:NADP-dependent malic enzyme [Pseudomonadota bacterium]MDA0965548.1 NADP-dependent malic enzyme [Pseudomonadota bacterium]MDG4542872.1 NADP-dependent malic enzyme [Rickettsiales bacterium]MDG4544680.1 NADP-dependent malic enzyme [Rickettsiales bacterium]MDG4546802.1 NADP-dependent malic enzyme [Rickettsiales bacterium]
MSEKKKGTSITDEDALYFHKRDGKPGKVAVLPTKPLMTQRDLSLAYSPGVAVPCLEIQKDESKAYEYTAKGNYVAVISNGTAVLGLGNLGALASKPVMEGKAVLFKRFADIDSVDIEVDTEDPEEFINAVKYLGPTWGGINLEDIKAPECFIIEQKLKEVMDIPIFHDDQHGTAIITAAGLINAAHVTGRKFKDMTIVVNGAGAASIACVELVKAMGVQHNNVILCDSRGVIYEGREDGMNQWKSAHAAKTKARSLADAMKGADVFLGLSVKDAVTKDMVKSMAKKPIIFAMANPDPEITPEDVAEVRSDAIVATGRSDYPNQVNNVMGFPYIFRGALDVRATTINEEMKIACAQALADLAREHVPDEVSVAYSGRKMQYGPGYIIPVPFDPRLIYTIPPAVAKAAMDSGVAKQPIEDMEEYKRQLSARLNPTANSLNLIMDRLHANPRNVVFSEGEEEKVIRAAAIWRRQGYGTAKLVGRENLILKKMAEMSIDPEGIEIHNAAVTDKNEKYIEFLYNRLGREGYLRRDCVRMVKNDRNIFAACMVQCGDADAMITGLTRNYYDSLDDILKVVNAKPGKMVFGLSMMIAKGKTVFISDTTVNELPTPDELADIAIQTAEEARKMGHVPRVAMLSFSTFGNLMRSRSSEVREVVEILDSCDVDFEYEGEMAADVALNPELMKLYPFSRLSGPANVLIMPALHSANISSKLLQELGGGTVIGPMLIGLEKPVQIVQMGASVSEILNMAALAAVNSISDEGKHNNNGKKAA